MKRAVEFLLGGVVVYVAMAVQAAGCAGSGPDGGPPSAQAGATGGGDAGFGGAPGNPSGGNAGALAQAGSGGSGGIFDPVPSADAKSGTRLKAKVYRGADGSEQSLFRWQDTERNEECAFAAAADGKIRCLPSAPLAAFYADAGCTIQALSALASAYCAGPPAYLAVAVPGCPGGTRIYQRGASPTSLYVGSPGACFQQSPTIPDGYAAYAVGAEVPLASFAEVTVETLPLGDRVFGGLGGRARVVDNAAIGHGYRERRWENEASQEVEVERGDGEW